MEPFTGRIIFSGADPVSAPATITPGTNSLWNGLAEEPAVTAAAVIAARFEPDEKGPLGLCTISADSEMVHVTLAAHLAYDERYGTKVPKDIKIKAWPSLQGGTWRVSIIGPWTTSGHGTPLGVPEGTDDDLREQREVLLARVAEIDAMLGSKGD